MAENVQGTQGVHEYALQHAPAEAAEGAGVRYFCGQSRYQRLFGLVFDATVSVKNVFLTTPPEGKCARINAPAFTMLRELTSRGSLSLLGRIYTALEVPRLGGVTAAEESGRRRRSSTSHASTHRLALRVGHAAGTPEGTCHLRGGDNNAPATTARVRTAHLCRTGSAPQVCPARRPPPPRYQQQQQQQQQKPQQQ